MLALAAGTAARVDAADGAKLQLCGSGVCADAAVGNTGQWPTLRAGTMAVRPAAGAQAGEPQLTLTAIGGGVVVHTVEVEFGEARVTERGAV